jgi:hypothetical protein
MLRHGMTGEDVQALQKLLNFHLGRPRMPLAADGIFGPVTQARVREFQSVNRLAADGVVGPQTSRALLDVRTVTATAYVRPEAPQPSFLRTLPSPFPRLELEVPPLLRPPGNPPTPLRANQPEWKTSYALTLQAGQQASLNPWFLSPLVLTAQLDMLMEHDERTPFLISMGGQAAFNQIHSPAGSWTGQAFINFGPNIAVGKSLFTVNPYVSILATHNQGQPWTLGLGAGGQISYAIIRRKNEQGKDQDDLVLFTSGLVLTNVGLNDGKVTGPPAGQVILGLSKSFYLF